MTHATQLVYAAAGQPSIEDAIELSGFCYLCGDEVTQGVPIKKALKDTFNNRDIAIRPDGVGFCCACAFSFSEQLEINGKTRQKFRTYSHLVAANVWLPLTKGQKDQMREFLLAEHAGYWLACISEAGQKHLLFRCPVNYGPGRFRILFEELIIETTRDEITDLITNITTLLSLGASKAAVETGNYPRHFLFKADLHTVEILEGEIAAHRGRGVFDLALFLSQKPEVANGTDRTETDGDRPCVDAPSLGGLEHLEKQGPQVLANTGRQHKSGGKLDKQPGPLRQYALFENATPETDTEGRKTAG